MQMFKNLLANCADIPHWVLLGIIFSVFSDGYTNAMLNAVQTLSNKDLRELWQSLVTAAVAWPPRGVCSLSSTHTSAIDSRVTTFWRNHFVEHEADMRIVIISGPFSRRLKAHYLQFFTTRLNYAVTFPASKLQSCFWLSKRWRNTMEGGRITLSEP